MDEIFLSRIQFAFTASFHYIYPPISIGLGFMMVVLGLCYLRTKNPEWRELSFFWVRIYGLVFALGIATGVVQEFEFGMNWANYSRFVGNIFGSALAAEGIFAFFLEGGFLGLMLFGGERLGPRMWLLAVALVAFGAHFSAIWIVIANSWMQTPSGYELGQGLRGTQVVMTDFFEVIFSPSFLPRIGHILVGAWLVGTTMMLSVSAWYILRNKHVALARKNLLITLPFFAIFSVLQMFLLGSQSAESVTEHQPAKLAAMEGIWETQSCAPMHLFGWVDEANEKTYGLAVPCLLSFLAHGDINATVTGLKDIPIDERPPVNLTFQSYHIMIMLGGLFVALSAFSIAYYLWKREKIFELRWLMWLFVLSIFLTELATMFGWWTAEIGRQPWAVYGLLRTVDGGSPGLTAEQVIFSLIMFAFIYAILFVLFIYLLNAKIQHGPDPLDEKVEVSSLPDTFREVFGRRARAEMVRNDDVA
jgi:cytochrome d ubiquinol oxidase subunit I